MLSWGLNQNYQLGQGDGKPRVVPQEVKSVAEKTFVSVKCGSRVTVALTVHGNVFTWGRGADGQLGNGSYDQVAVPSVVQDLEGKRIVRIATRGSHILALTDSGFVYSWGRNDSGQLGLGDKRSRSRPHVISMFKNQGLVIKDIACGRMHSVALGMSGELYSWGCGDEGATGLSTTSTVYEPQKIEDLHNVVQVACGSRHTLAVTEPENQEGEQGSLENELYSWGWNSNGQLGLGDNVNRNSPMLVKFPVDSSQDGFLLGDSASEHGGRLIIHQISCGYRHSMAVIIEESNQSSPHSPDSKDRATCPSELWAWGWNQYRQLGFSSEVQSVILPTLVSDLPHEVYKIEGGGRHTLAILRRKRDNAKRIYSWGRGDDGQLGIGMSVQSAGPSRTRTAGENVELIAAGWSHSVCVQSKQAENLEKRLKTEARDRVSMRFPSFAFRPRLTPGKPKTRLQKALAVFNCSFSDVFSFGNIDGGFAQLLNTIILFLMILQSLHLRAGFDEELVISRVLPGASITILVSNLGFGLYGEALRYATATDSNVSTTAIPHGINTVLFFAFTMLIMVPEYQKSGDARIAYRTGLACSFLLGLLELPCVLLVGIFQEYIPRAAMMSALAGVSLTFISMTFVVQIYSAPVVGILPMMIILISYGSNVRLPFKLPATLAALGLGAIIAYFLRAVSLDQLVPKVDESDAAIGMQSLFLPSLALSELFEGIIDSRTWPYVTSVVLPMLLVNLVNNLSCVESAIAVGDDYSAKKVLFADALVTIVGALFGNPFPTAVYIGHPAFKAMGATTGYSYINGVLVFFIGILNGTQKVNQIVPQIAGVGLLMWIGIAVTANAFEVEKSHMPAVAFGLLPALASWCLQHVESVISACSNFLDESGSLKLPFDDIVYILEKNGVHVYGLISLSNGYLLSAIFLASTLVHIIEREFSSAAMWMFLASFLSFIGAVHSFDITPTGSVTTYGFPAHGKDEYPIQYAITYFSAGILLLMFQLRESDATWLELLRMLRRDAPNFERIGDMGVRLRASSLDEDHELANESETTRLVNNNGNDSIRDYSSLEGGGV